MSYVIRKVFFYEKLPYGLPNLEGFCLMEKYLMDYPIHKVFCFMEKYLMDYPIHKIFVLWKITL